MSITDDRGVTTRTTTPGVGRRTVLQAAGVTLAGGLLADARKRLPLSAAHWTGTDA